MSLLSSSPSLKAEMKEREDEVSLKNSLSTVVSKTREF